MTSYLVVKKANFVHRGECGQFLTMEAFFYQTPFDKNWFKNHCAVSSSACGMWIGGKSCLFKKRKNI